jgi:hypothetical protein
MQTTTKMSLEERIQALEDAHEIANLKATYINWADGGWNGLAHDPANRIPSLFTEDGIWDGGVYGSFHGRDEIRDFFSGTRERLVFGYHRISVPKIEVDGDTATGEWHLVCTVSEGRTAKDQVLALDDGTAVFFAGMYSDQFVRTPDGWKFNVLSFRETYHHQESEQLTVAKW